MKNDLRNAGQGACPEARALEAFQRGRLPASEARAVEEHAQTCRACRSALADHADSAEFGRLLRDWRARVDPGIEESAHDTVARLRREPKA